MVRLKNKRCIVFLAMVCLLIASFFLVSNVNAQDRFPTVDINQQLPCGEKELKVFAPHPLEYQQISIEKAIQMENYSSANQYVISVELKSVETLPNNNE